MSEHRRSTIYDYTDLRLHPDGSRVAQKSSNRRPTLLRVATQTSRANWIANDAGGSGRIPKFRKKKIPSDNGDQEEFEANFPEAKDAQAEESGSEQESGPKKRKSKRFDGRPLKRQKFKAQEDYITPGSAVLRQTSGNDLDSPDHELALPEPSPDLLKCVHRFAAEFYTERGELLNISRQWRRERKERRRLRQQTAQDVSDDELSSSDSSISKSQSSTDSESEASAEEDREDGLDEQDDGLVNQKGKQKARDPAAVRKRNEEVFVDMYKRFDGSAMMALGMLVQENIARRLKVEPPAGWTKLREGQVKPLTEPRKTLLVLKPNKNPTRHSKRLVKGQAIPTRSSNPRLSEEEQDDEDQAESLRSEDTANSDSEADFR